MQRILPRLVLLLAFCLAPCAAQTLQLAGGQTLLAEVEEATGEGLRIKRLDNGGTLELRWEHLSTASALDLKRRFDLLGDSGDEVLTTAEEVSYLVGGQPNRVVGKVLERTGNLLVVMVRGVPYRIPTAELRGMRQVQVPVHQVFTKDEYYSARLAEDPPGDAADRHVLLAEDLLKMRDYDHAQDHLQKAKDLDNSRDKPRVDAMLAKLARYKEAARERDLLDLIQASRSRGQLADFEKGGKLIEQFDKEFPTSKLKQDFDAEKRKFAEARGRYLTHQVAEQFKRGVQLLADKKAGEADATLQAVRDYAENGMSDDLFTRVAAQLHLELPETKDLWANRSKLSAAKRTEHYTFGLGSWILGEAGVIKGTAAEKANEQQAQTESANNEAQRDLERVQRALREALQRRRAAAQAQGGQQQKQEETDEDWWRKVSRVERAGWLRAYYAEFGRQMVVTSASTAQCITCYGQGTLPEMGPDGKMVRGKCYLCHGTKWLRSVRAY